MSHAGNGDPNAHAVNAIFATPLHAFRLMPSDGTDADQLVTALYAMRDKGLGQASDTEWIGPTDLQRHPASQWLCEGLLPLAAQAVGAEGWAVEGLQISEMWGALSEPGNQHDRHHHANAWIAGVYYLKTQPDSGPIHFHDPIPQRSVIRPAFQRETNFTRIVQSIPPEDGLLLLFPGWLNHSIGVNNSDADRISIAFNLMPTGPAGRPTGRFDYGSP